MLNELLIKNNMSVYECSKKSGVPYTTLLEVVKGKTTLRKCSADTVYKLSKVLHLTMEQLLKIGEYQPISIENFKSNICHELKSLGDKEFLLFHLKCDDVTFYWHQKCYFEAFYLLATIDYVSRINEIPLYNKYDDLRCKKLEKTVFPQDIILLSKLYNTDSYKQETIKKAIPEFIRFNIAEVEIRNVA